MSRTRFDDRLSDSDARVAGEVEAHLDRYLAIEPSPEFAAKVRARIASEAAAPGRRWGPLFMALATASALIIAFTLRDGRDVRVNGGPVMSTPPHDVVARTAPALNGTTIARKTTVAIPVRRSPRAVPPRVTDEPEIIVDPSFAEAIRRLAQSPPYMSLDVTTDSPSASISGEPAPLSIADPLDVPELVLKPADQSGGQ